MSTGMIALILEDEPILGFALEDMLLELGFEAVELATTLDAARQYLQSGSPHVAILDVNIHGERSYCLIETLKANSVPFVFASGYGDAEHPEELRNVATITKPYSLHDLRTSLSTAMGISVP